VCATCFQIRSCWRGGIARSLRRALWLNHVASRRRTSRRRDRAAAPAHAVRRGCAGLACAGITMRACSRCRRSPPATDSQQRQIPGQRNGRWHTSIWRTTARHAPLAIPRAHRRPHRSLPAPRTSPACSAPRMPDARIDGHITAFLNMDDPGLGSSVYLGILRCTTPLTSTSIFLPGGEYQPHKL